VEFEGGPGEPLRVAALLVGPGAYRPRLPGWIAAPVQALAGKAVVRVPWAAVEHVTSRIALNRTAEELGLARSALELHLVGHAAKLALAVEDLEVPQPGEHLDRLTLVHFWPPEVSRNSGSAAAATSNSTT
jgi:hypothetical protein